MTCLRSQQDVCELLTPEMAGPGPQQEDTIGLWLNKATDPENPEENWESIQRLCDLVNADPEGPLIATRVLAHKIQSPQEPEALKALTVLETCINNCGTSFHQEIGKFRFLNELIKVLSPKFLGSWSTDSVKERIIEILYSWTVWFPEESKIQTAYRTLKKNGIIKKDPKLPRDKLLPPPSPRPKDSIFDDEEKSQLLARLLKSNHPEDLKAANRLIKTLIKEEQEKNEKHSRRVAAINDVHRQTTLLADMVSKCQKGCISPRDRQEMQNLYERCEKLRPTLFRLASDTLDNDEALAEVLRVNDKLTQDLSMYRQIVGGSGSGEQILAAAPANGADKRENGGPEVTRSYRLIDFSSLNGMEEVGQRTAAPALLSMPSICVLEEELLSLELKDSPTFRVTSPDTGPAQLAVQNGFPSAQNSPRIQTAGGRRPLGGSGGQDQGSVLDFGTSSSLKPPLPPSSHSELRQFSGDRLSPLDLPGPNMEMQPHFEKNSSCAGTPKGPLQQVPVPALPSPTSLGASLDSLFIRLESIRPSSIVPVTVYDHNGLKVMLHVSSETAPDRPDVMILVLSVLSTAPEPTQHIMFQAAVPKVMRIKLQPPSSSELPPFNPLLPPEVISQVLLICNPQKEQVRMKYKLTFNQACQAFSDVGEIHSSLDGTVWKKIR
ncbi:ADP-ribosylation factor-binding protein GGA2 isoform X2 [Lissotriton helveticus]